MSHETLLLGIDAGGTSTRAVLADADGRCLGYGVGGRGNPISAGPARAAQGVLDAVMRALQPAGRTLADVTGAVAAMAGMRASGGSAWLHGPLREHGFTGALTFESDILAAYFSGSAASFGYALVSGTGACVVRVEDGRIEGTGDGLGWLLGDRGSGFWIGHAVATAAVQELDSTGPATALTARVLAHYGIPRTGVMHQGRPEELERLIEVLYAHPPIELAALAPYAFADADAVAERILQTAGAHLADTLSAVLTGPGPLVVGGSVLARTGPVQDAFLARLGGAAEALAIRPVGDGAVGAAFLALRAAGVRADEETLTTLTESLALLR